MLEHYDYRHRMIFTLVNPKVISNPIHACSWAKKKFIFWLTARQHQHYANVG
jgi:hypothetical protein